MNRILVHVQAALLATLAFADCGIAAPNQSLEIAPTAFVKEASRRDHFPSATVLNGRSCGRLTGVALKRAIVGKSIDPATRCRGCTDSGSTFNADGTYLEDGDRWTGGGRYIIAHDLVLIRVEGRALRWAFYRDPGDKLLLSFETAEGDIRFLEVTAS